MVLRFLIIAGIFFLISCGDIERNNPDDPSSPNYQGSGAASSSSSVPIQTDVVYGPDVSYGDEIYKTVKIGTQTWFQRNLNYKVSGSKCYDDLESNCQKYGKLYDWATAMSLDASCNLGSCDSQTKHKGICPIGWHIPSGADWNTLMKYVNSSCLDNSNCAAAGTKLKATSGWNEGGDGEDAYGFSALPGGFGYSTGGFDKVGLNSDWWSADGNYSNYAYSRGIYYDLDGAIWNFSFKVTLYSVRCLQN